MAATAATAYVGRQAAHFAQDLQQEQPDEQYLSTFFCRALYDYRSDDNSSLSFSRGDIIEVLTQLESGWWDGLLNDERGWFPSNYVQPISVQEAEAEFSRLESSGQMLDGHDPGLDPRFRFRGENSEREELWIHEEQEFQRQPTADRRPAHASRAPGVSNDFWVPRVAENGQIFYLNTHTGERSRDLPSEMHDDMSDPELAQVNRSAGRIRSPLRDSGSLVNGQSASGTNRAGFGVTKRSGTPEPWVKRLADDGMTYYYMNKENGRVVWSRPQGDDNLFSADDARYHNGHQSASEVTPSLVAHASQSSANDVLFAPSRVRADSTTSQTQASSNRQSVYSDDSDIQPRDRDNLEQSSKSNGATDYPDIGKYDFRHRTANSDYERDPELSTAEQTAIMLQQALSPPEPDSIDFLSDITRDGIIAIMQSVDDNGLPKGADHDKEVENRVGAVVVAVRNLLYVSCALYGSLPGPLVDKTSSDANSTAVAQQLQSQLKASQRKVTATLSKLVLSAKAARCKRDASSSDLLMRVEQDAADLQRAVDNFVTEVKRQHARTAIKQLHARIGRRRLRGIFSLNNLGTGLSGSGAAASWKGFGFIDIDEGLGLPKRTLDEDSLDEAKDLLHRAEAKLEFVLAVLEEDNLSSDILQNAMADVLANVNTFLSFVADLNIAQEVDVDGLHENGSSLEDRYMQAVASARSFLRKLEWFTQRVYDDSAVYLLLSQDVEVWDVSAVEYGRKIKDKIRNSSSLVQDGTAHVVKVLTELLDVRREQRSLERSFRESMGIRMSRQSMTIENNGRLSNFFGNLEEQPIDENEDVIDMEMAFRKTPGTRPVMGSVEVVDHEQKVPELPEEPAPVEKFTVPVEAQEPRPSIEVEPLIAEDTGRDKDKAPPRAAKIRQLLGPDAPERYIDLANADSKPWYLRSDHNRDDLIINPDGGIRAGSLAALIERLTSHEYGDPIFIRTFLMTYKSFTTLNDFFDLLVTRYHIQPPKDLAPAELEEWAKLKQHVIRSRVLNTLKTMVIDPEVLEKEDEYILDRMKEFLSEPDVAQAPAAKNLLAIIERKKVGGQTSRTMTPQNTFPPPPITPKNMNKNKLKLLDIDALEIARQLTIMEFALYKKIRAIECLQRAREQRPGERDHITDVIQMTNKIANWVNSTILSKEDSRKRAALVKHFISVADRCRNLHNFSSMAAIISGLNSPPIRRLKRTWDQVGGRFMSQLGTCEMTLDSTKNFTNYKATLAQVNPPCIPFIGVYLTTLTFIQDGSKDVLPGNLINFGKRQRAAEIIREIQHWQSKEFSLQPVLPILAFIEEALGSFSESVDWGEHFWNLSLEREPREREDERMARLLQESGFL